MAARSSKLFYSSPIIIILGATGTGKSKLAIEIAKKFKGEIINADAMQMYKGLDIATNKVTSAEQDGVPHHLLGFLNPMKKLTVCEFRNYAVNAVKDIINREKIPVIVGGTHYYIESILYNVLLSPTERGSAAKNEDSSTSDENPSDDLMNEILPRKKMKLDNYENLLSEYEKFDNEKLHEKLGEVDPEMAKILHPNNRRKILRSLMVYEQFGEPLSSLLNKQRSLPGGCDSGGPLRFTNSVILWMKCDFSGIRQQVVTFVPTNLETTLSRRRFLTLVACRLQFHKFSNRFFLRREIPESGSGRAGAFKGQSLKNSKELLKSSGTILTVPLENHPLEMIKMLPYLMLPMKDTLIPRLDARVDKMLSQGLTNELLDFHKKYNEENLSKNETPDYTKGIFQSIGFKEFHDYLIMDDEKRESEEGKKLFERGVELLKIATRQYAKRQIKWIQNRFLKDGRRQVPPIYEMNGSNLSRWKENVSDIAEEVVEAHLTGRKPSVEPSKVEGRRELVDKTYRCEICQKVLVGKAQWGIHLKSNKHARVVKRKNRLEKQLDMQKVSKT